MTAVENKGRKDEEFEGGRRGGRAERLQNQSGDKIWAAVGLLGMDASCLPPYFCFFFLPLSYFLSDRGRSEIVGVFPSELPPPPEQKQHDLTDSCEYVK